MSIESFLPISAESYAEIREKIKFVLHGVGIEKVGDAEQIVLPGATVALRREAEGVLDVRAYLVYSGKVIRDRDIPAPVADGKGRIIPVRNGESSD